VCTCFYIPVWTWTWLHTKPVGTPWAVGTWFLVPTGTPIAIDRNSHFNMCGSVSLKMSLGPYGVGFTRQKMCLCINCVSECALYGQYWNNCVCVFFFFFFFFFFKLQDCFRQIKRNLVNLSKKLTLNPKWSMFMIMSLFILFIFI